MFRCWPLKIVLKNCIEICFVLAFSNVSCINGHMGWITNLSNKWSTVYCLVWYENDFIKKNSADGSSIALCTGIAAVTAGSSIELFFSFQKNRDFTDRRSFYTDLTVCSKIRHEFYAVFCCLNTKARSILFLLLPKVTRIMVLKLLYCTFVSCVRAVL